MAEQHTAVGVSNPPEFVMRVVNRLVRALLGTPLAGSLGKQLMVLKFRGRKSGQPYSIPVSAHRLDGALYALIAAPWKRNFRGGRDTAVLVDGATTAMRGELIEERDAVAELCLRCASAYGVKRAQRMMGLTFRDARIPTLAEFSAAVDEYGLAAIRFVPA